MKAQAHSPRLFSPFTTSRTLFSTCPSCRNTCVRPFRALTRCFSSFFFLVSPFYQPTPDFHSRHPRRESGLSVLCVKCDWINLQVSPGLRPAFPA